MGRKEAEELAARAERHRAETAANEASITALQQWYRRGRVNADAAIPMMQIEINLKRVNAIPGWREEKGNNNGYVMLDMLVSGELRPVIVVLDFTSNPSGELTYRQLHRQIRWGPGAGAESLPATALLATLVKIYAGHALPRA